MYLTTEMRDALFGRLERVSGFGIRAIGLNPNRTINGKFGISCVLYADELLTEQVLDAPERAYHEQLVMVYRSMVASMQPYMQSGVRFCESEPLTLAMNDEQVCAAAGVRYEEDYFHVPPTGFKEFKPSLNVDASAEGLSNWGRVIVAAPSFNPDDPNHKAWISLALLPCARVADIGDATFRRSVIVTQFGWAATTGPDDRGLASFAAELKSAAHEIEHQGWIRTL